MLTQEEYDGLQFLLENPVGRLSDREETERLIDAELAKMRADPVKYAQESRRSINRGFGHRSVKFLLNHHPATRGMTREDRESLLSVADGSVGLEGPVGMSPEDKAKWDARIQRWLPVLKVIATFTPPPYNMAVIGLIVLLVWIDENRLKPQQAALVTMVADSLGNTVQGRRSPTGSSVSQQRSRSMAASTVSASVWWAAIITPLIDGIVGMFPASLQATVRQFLDGIFGQASKVEPVPDSINLLGASGTAVAPDEIKSAIKQLVATFVQKYLADRPILLKIAMAFVNNLPDSFIDGIWDSIFKAQIAAGTLPTASPWAGKTQAEPALPTPTPEECKAVVREVTTAA